MSSPRRSNQANESPRCVKVVIPEGDNTLWVAGPANHTGLTSEEGLRTLGREMVGGALTPNYGWSDGTTTTYVADPISAVSRGMGRLTRQLYEQRWTPDVP